MLQCSTLPVLSQMLHALIHQHHVKSVFCSFNLSVLLMVMAVVHAMTLYSTDSHPSGQLRLINDQHNVPCICSRPTTHPSGRRWGPVGQGRLLCDLHSALVRVLEGLDEDLMEAPTMAGYGSATDMAPADSYKPLLGAAWPELARRYLQ